MWMIGEDTLGLNFAFFKIKSFKSIQHGFKACKFEHVIIVDESISNEWKKKKKTWCFAPKTCVSWGTSMEPINLTLE